jgi:hypothetical protein
MIGLSFKSVCFSLAIVCFLGSSAVADSFTFTGTATLGGDLINFFLSGPSFSIHSASPGGPASEFAVCLQGTLCTVAEFIQTTPSSVGGAGGDFSGGTVGGVTADTLGSLGGLSFSGFSFTAGTNPNNFGSGPVTFTGDLTGFVFLPLGCENTQTCTAVGPQVFHLHLSGSGTGRASGEVIGQGLDGIFLVDYTFHGTATTVPEPSSLLFLSSGLTGLAALKRWHLLRRVNK